MTREEQLKWLKQIEKDIYVCSLESTFSDDAKSCAIHSVIEKLEQEPIKDDENELKFYYVESIDDYWIGQRLGNFYYANWDEDLGFVWSRSRYLPWGEHIVNKNTLWKEHTYPSEPVEIPFTKWIVGFMKKYSTEPKKGHWIEHPHEAGPNWEYSRYECSECHDWVEDESDYCPYCGAEMESD